MWINDLWQATLLSEAVHRREVSIVSCSIPGYQLVIDLLQVFPRQIRELVDPGSRRAPG